MLRLFQSFSFIFSFFFFSFCKTYLFPQFSRFFFVLFISFIPFFHVCSSFTLALRAFLSSFALQSIYTNMKCFIQLVKNLLSVSFNSLGIFPLLKPASKCIQFIVSINLSKHNFTSFSFHFNIVYFLLFLQFKHFIHRRFYIAFDIARQFSLHTLKWRVFSCRHSEFISKFFLSISFSSFFQRTVILLE